MPRHSVAVSVNWSGKTSRYVAEERLGGEEMRRYISPPLRRRRYSVTCYVYGVPRISTKLFQVRLTLSEHVCIIIPCLSSSSISIHIKFIPNHPPAVPPPQPPSHPHIGISPSPSSFHTTSTRDIISPPFTNCVFQTCIPWVPVFPAWALVRVNQKPR